MRKGYLLIVSAIVLVQLSCTTKKIYNGHYETNRYLIELNNGYYLIKDKFSENYLCCDSLSWGNYEKIKNNNFIKLTSEESILEKYIDFNVVENIKKSSDTIYININNPIEERYKSYRDNKREIYYKIVLFSNKSHFDSKLYSQKWNQNQIKFSIPKDYKIEYFYIEIFVEDDIMLPNRIYNKFSTFDYKLQDNKSNYFEINMEDLNYNFLNFLRLNDEYLKIDRKKIIWRGEEFLLVK